MRILVLISLVALGYFIYRRFFPNEKQYDFGGDNEIEQRVNFYNYYQRNGATLEPEDKALYNLLLEAGLVTFRGTDIVVIIKNEGLVILAEEEFKARCDRRASAIKFFYFLCDCIKSPKLAKDLLKEKFNARCHLRRARVK